MLRQGFASEQILAAARELGADLIVMGTHGRRGVPRMLIGSAAEKVVRQSPIPVLIVRLSEAEGKRRRRRLGDHAPELRPLNFASPAPGQFGSQHPLDSGWPTQSSCIRFHTAFAMAAESVELGWMSMAANQSR